MNILKRYINRNFLKSPNYKINLTLEGYIITQEDIKKIFSVYGIEKYYKKIIPNLKSKIDLLIRPFSSEEDLSLGESKVGGRADLPDNILWPKDKDSLRMSFIAQINIKEIKKYDSDNLLPNSGMLSFFYPSNNSPQMYEDCSGKVIYIKDLRCLNRQNFPSDLEKTSRYRFNNIYFTKCLSLPDTGNETVRDIFNYEDACLYIDASNTSENQIFGYPNYIQGSAEEEDEILLFQIGSEEIKTGMQWGDDGKVYYFINRKDLKNLRFDRVRTVLQCG